MRDFKSCRVDANGGYLETDTPKKNRTRVVQCKGRTPKNAWLKSEHMAEEPLPWNRNEVPAPKERHLFFDDDENAACRLKENI